MSMQGHTAWDEKKPKKVREEEEDTPTPEPALNGVRRLPKNKWTIWGRKVLCVYMAREWFLTC